MIWGEGTILVYETCGASGVDDDDAAAVVDDAVVVVVVVDDIVVVKMMLVVVIPSTPIQCNLIKSNLL